jgi:hypothetical protein
MLRIVLENRFGRMGAHVPTNGTLVPLVVSTINTF